MKTFISNNLFNSKNALDSNKIKESWFINNGFHSEYTEILQITEFLPVTTSFTNRLYCIYNTITFTPICPVCDINLVKFNTFSKGYFEYCSSKCSANSEKTRSKFKDTFVERYGAENSFKCQEIMDKAKDTLLCNYGVTVPMHSTIIKEKVEATNLEKYGSEYGFGSELIQEKIKNTNLEKYGAIVPNSDPEVIAFLSNKEWLESQLLTNNTKTIATNLGCSVSFVNKWAREHELYDRIASYSQENEIYDHLISIVPAEDIQRGVYGIIGNKSGKGRKQLDLYVKEKQLAIELNGVYWHLDDKDRHLKKRNLCKDKGISLLQFWDYQWDEKTEICKSIINSYLGVNRKVYARKCSIIELSSTEYSVFMNTNHLQGNVNSSVKYGLVFDGEIVSVIGFSKSRYNKNYDWELTRYANKLNTNVIGGFSKLLSHFRKNITGSIISYCDLMVFTGKMYEQAGFRFLRNSPPGFNYYFKNRIYSREALQKHKLKEILNVYDETLSADDNLSNNGFSKFWNCGNGVWVLGG